MPKEEFPHLIIYIALVGVIFSLMFENYRLQTTISREFEKVRSEVFAGMANTYTYLIDRMVEAKTLKLIKDKDISDRDFILENFFSLVPEAKGRVKAIDE